MSLLGTLVPYVLQLYLSTTKFSTYMGWDYCAAIHGASSIRTRTPSSMYHRTVHAYFESNTFSVYSSI